MGTTPTFAFRYPEPTDPVAAGADNIKNLALDTEQRFTDHVTHGRYSATLGGGTAVPASSGVGPFNIPSAGLWFISTSVDLASGTGYGYIDHWLSSFSTLDRIGDTLVDPLYYESNAGRHNLAGLFALWFAAPFGLYVRTASYSGSCPYNSVKLQAWQLYKGGPS